MSRARALVRQAAIKLDQLGPMWRDLSHDELVMTAQTIGETKALLAEAIGLLDRPRRRT